MGSMPVGGAYSTPTHSTLPSLLTLFFLQDRDPSYLSGGGVVGSGPIELDKEGNHLEYHIRGIPASRDVS